MKKLMCFLGLLLLSGCVYPWQKIYIPNSVAAAQRPAIQAAKESAEFYRDNTEAFGTDTTKAWADANAEAWKALDEIYDAVPKGK